MQSTARTRVLRMKHEGIDTRVVLRVYGVVAITVGATITGTGIRGIPGVSHAYASVIWITGMAIVAAGCAACGLALNDDPTSRQRSLRWFAAGHVLLGLFVWMQWAIYWRLQGIPLPAALAPLLIGIVLLAASAPWRWGSVEDTALIAPQRIRSTYDEHIRQIARREERARLARDLHDAVKQQLFVIQTAAATAETRFDDDASGAREALTHVRTAARDATAEMAALLDELQATPMENTGLVEALKKQCEALALRTGADIRFHPGTMPPVGSLPPGAHEAIYRVAQEALANVARHARASRVDVLLQSSNTQLELRIMDDGSGFDADAARIGMGIANMETRAGEIGGRLSFVPRSPGTAVVLTVPLPHPAVRAAWHSAAVFALGALCTSVFYVIRGASRDLSSSLVFLGVVAVWVALRFVAAYWKPWRELWR